MCSVERAQNMRFEMTADGCGFEVCGQVMTVGGPEGARARFDLGPVVDGRKTTVVAWAREGDGRWVGTLSEGGRVALMDLKAIPLVRLLAPHGHWTPVETMRSEMSEASYALTERFDFLPAQSFVVFRPI